MNAKALELAEHVRWWFRIKGDLKLKEAADMLEELGHRHECNDDPREVSDANERL